MTGFILLAGCLLLSGCFLKKGSSAPEPAPVAEVGQGESTANAVPQARPADARPRQVGQYLQAIGSAPAGAAVTKGLQPYFGVGLGFIVAGGIAVFLGMRANGVALCLMGVACTMVGVLFTQYPFVALLPAIIAGLIVYDRWREKRRRQAAEGVVEKLEGTVEVLAENIEKAPEAGEVVKTAIKAAGPEVESLVRSVVGPIKTKLKKLGKIAVG